VALVVGLSAEGSVQEVELIEGDLTSDRGKDLLETSTPESAYHSFSKIDKGAHTEF